MKKITTKKMALTAMLACLAFVLNTFVYFPAMALCGIMRMMSGRTIQAVTGAIFGPVLGGLIYRKTKNVYLVFVGEVFGTGVIGACASYPLMKMFYGLDAQSPFYYIPFYTPSAIVGAAMGVVVVLILKKTGVLNRMQNELS